MYLLAIIIPPLAVLLCGKPGQAILNFFLCLLLFVPGVIHALFVVNERKARQRQEELVAVIAATQRRPD